MTSEEILGFTIPPDHQCDNIDEYVMETKAVDFYGVAMLGQWEHVQNYEKLRIACSELRDWGAEWKELAKELINKYEPEQLYGEEM